MPAFRINFVDGPWAGQSCTLEHSIPVLEVTRAGDHRLGTEDTIFVYKPAASRNVMGMEEADFKLYYDGPPRAFAGFVFKKAVDILDEV